MRKLKITIAEAAIAFSSAIYNAQTDNQFTNKNNKGENFKMVNMLKIIIKD